MRLFKRSKKAIWKYSLNLLADTVEAFMDKLITMYEQDAELSERMEKEKFMDIQLELCLLLVQLFNAVISAKASKIREELTSAMCFATVHSFNLDTYNLDIIDPGIPYSITELLQDRIERYSMIPRWKPTAYWWLGEKELSQKTHLQHFALFGDYITYYRVNKMIPIGNDIEAVVLVDPLDCETLATAFVVLELVYPAAMDFFSKLDDFIY